MWSSNYVKCLVLDDGGGPIFQNLENIQGRRFSGMYHKLFNHIYVPNIYMFTHMIMYNNLQLYMYMLKQVK